MPEYVTISMNGVEITDVETYIIVNP